MDLGESALPTFEVFRLAVQRRYDGLSRQLRKVAHYAIERPEAVALETVAVIALKIDVHPSAVVRFAQAFGFDGFRGLQQVCRERLMLDKDSYSHRIRSITETGNPPPLLDNFIQAAVGSLKRLCSAAPPEKVEVAVSALMRARHIHLVGQRRSYAVVQYLHYALSRLERCTLLADGAGGMIESQLARCSTEDTVLAVSFSPYSREVVEIVHKLAAAGVKVVAITDSPLSPLSRNSEVSFEISEGETIFRSLAAPICLAQVLVVSLGQALQQARLDETAPTIRPSECGKERPGTARAGGKT